MASPILLAWAFTWIVLNIPYPLPSPVNPWQLVRFIVGLLFLIWTLIALLVSFGVHV